MTARFQFIQENARSKKGQGLSFTWNACPPCFGRSGEIVRSTSPELDFGGVCEDQVFVSGGDPAVLDQGVRALLHLALVILFVLVEHFHLIGGQRQLGGGNTARSEEHTS